MNLPNLTAQSQTTIGSLYCKEGVIMGADRRWSICSSYGGLPYRVGETNKLASYMQDNEGRFMFVVATTGACSVMEAGLPRLFHYLLPEYLKKVGIDLQKVDSQFKFYSLFKAFLAHLSETGSINLVYRNACEAQTHHLVTFRNKSLVTSFYFFPPTTIIPIQNTCHFKKLGPALKEGGCWAMLGSGQVHLNAALSVSNARKRFLDQTLEEGETSMTEGFRSAILYDCYSNPGSQELGEDLYDSGASRMDTQGNCSLIDLATITTKGVKIHSKNLLLS